MVRVTRIALCSFKAPSTAGETRGVGFDDRYRVLAAKRESRRLFDGVLAEHIPTSTQATPVIAFAGPGVPSSFTPTAVLEAWSGLSTGQRC